MATELVPSSSVYVEFSRDGETPTVSSKDLARHFAKKHKHILDEIARIRSIVPPDFYGPNFRPIEESVLLPHSGGIRKDPAFRLTRDAFCLLAMGFTGTAAIRWKLKYIEAFNALEAGALENARAAALEEGRKAALTEATRLALPEAFRLHKRLTPERVAQIKKALVYEARGFYHVEIAKMLDCSHDKARELLRDARAVGLAAPKQKGTRRAGGRSAKA